MNKAKPIINQGQKIPFDALEPDPFADFIFSCLVIIQSKLNVEMVGKPTGTNDKGFDAIGKIPGTNKIVCFQVKRYSSTKLSLAHIGSELCKVALTSVLENSDISQHYIITSGKVEQKIYSAEREADKELFVSSALKELGSDKYSVKKEQLESRHLNPSSIVESYVRQLDKIVIWDNTTFDAMIATHWREILEVTERYFHIQTLLKEYPRPNFDRFTYLQQNSSTELIDLFHFGNTDDVPNIRRQSASTPLSQNSRYTLSIREVKDLFTIPTGNVVILTGAGGTGKSSVLEILQSKLCKALLSEEHDNFLPIKIELNGLDTSIEQTIKNVLGITWGAWQSLPNKILLLLDGLNEVDSTTAKTLINQVNNLIQNSKLSVVMTVRDSGLRNPVVVKNLLQTVEVYPLGPRQVRKLVGEYLPCESIETFLLQYRSHADLISGSFLWTPFATLTAIKCFQETGDLPTHLCELLDRVYIQQFKRNEELFITLPSELQIIPVESVIELSRNVAFLMQVKYRTLSLSGELLPSVLNEAIKTSSDTLGIDCLDSLSALRLLTVYEQLVLSGKCYSFRHELISGFLAAKRLSQEWESNTDSLESTISDDTWLFACYYLSEARAQSYLQYLATKDIILAARASKEASSKCQEVIVEIIYQLFETTNSDLLRRICTISLGFVGSDNAVNLLRKITHIHDPNIVFCAQRALAQCGEVNFLRELQPEIENSRSAGLGVSGGDLPIWDSAPQWVRLMLARERIAAVGPNAPICDSLFQLAYEGDATDIESIKSCISEADTHSQFSQAIFALYNIDRAIAIEFLEELFTTSSIQGKSVIVIEVAQLGEAFKIEWATKYICGDFYDIELDNPENNKEILFSIMGINKHLLSKYTLPREAIKHLIDKVVISPRDEYTQYAWSVISCNGLCEAYDIARNELVMLGYFRYYSCLYFQNVMIKDTDKELIFSTIASFLIEKPHYWFKSESRGLLRLLAHYNQLHRVKDVVLKMQNLVAEKQRILLQTKTSKSLDRSSRVDEMLNEIVDYLTFFKADLSIKNKLLFLTVETSYNFDMQLIEIIRDLPDDTIDSVLLMVDHPLYLSKILKNISTLGFTNTRLKTCQDLLPNALTRPATMHYLLDAIKNLWNKDIARMVCSVISHMDDWGKYGVQFVDSLTKWVTKNLTLDQAIELICPLIEESKTQESRELLQYWYDSITIIRRM